MNKKFLNFVKNVGEFKFLTFVYFGSAVIIYAIIGFLMGEKSLDFVTMWEMLLASVIFTFMQYLFYLGDFFPKLSQKAKIAIHFILSYVILLVLSALFHWFDIGNTGLIALLSAIYILFYVALFIGFSIYYKAEGHIFNKKLMEYKKNK